MADQAALIATLSLRMDKFEKQMADAGKTADKAVKDIEDKFEKANPQLGGGIFAGTLFGNLAAKGARELVGILREVFDQIKEIEKAAELAQVSMSQAFGVVAAVGLDNTAKVLNQVGLELEKIRQGQQDNRLAEFLSANNIKIGKDTATVIEQIGQALAKTNASLAEITLAGQRLGLPAEALQRLQMAAGKSAEEMQKTADLATKVGRAWEIAGNTLSLVWIAIQGGIAAVIDSKARFFQFSLEGFANLIEAARAYAVALQAPAILTDAMATSAASLRDVAAGFAAISAGAKAKIEQLNQATKDLLKTRIEVQKSGTLKIPGFAGGGGDDVLQRELDRLNKRIELLKAEKNAIGENAGETARLRAEAEALQNLQRQGREVTQAEIDAIKQKTVELGKAAQATDDARKKFEAIVDASRTVGSALSTAFADAVVEGKKLNDVLKSLEKTLLKAAISSAFGSLFGKEGLGGILGALANRQHGGPVSGGRGYIVGEKGPELFVPRMSGRIVPGGGGAGGIHVAYNIDATGADQAAIARLERGLVATNASIESRVRTTMREDMRRRA